MPPEYPVEQLMIDIMAVVKDAMVYIVPAAILIACIAFVIRWFMYGINLGDWVFGSRR